MKNYWVRQVNQIGHYARRTDAIWSTIGAMRVASGLDFSSDNASGVAPEVMAALAKANSQTAPSYGGDIYTDKLTAEFEKLFDCAVWVFPVLTGTAANALALSSISPPYGGIFVHEQSHVWVHECGAPEFYSGGAKLIPVGGACAKIPASTLRAEMAKFQQGDFHEVLLSGLSITQSTEFGCVYQPGEIRALSDTAKSRSMKVHMDGARFANAVASLGCHPADITWRAGVDVLSFGATKNGAMAAEAVVYFSQDLAKEHMFRQKRGGHVPSKMRFVSVQMLALLENGLWLRNAEHANKMAERLAQGAAALGCAPAIMVEANEVFFKLPQTQVDALRGAGVQFHPHGELDGHGLHRFVTSFNTTGDDVDQLLALLGR